MRATVFDSYAVLALLFKEPGTERVQEILQEAAMAAEPVLISAVNWAEVLYRADREQGAVGVAETKRFEQSMPLEVVPADLELAELAARFKANHKMSLADAFAAALAQHNKAQLVTGDAEFKSIEHQLKKIVWLK